VLELPRDQHTLPSNDHVSYLEYYIHPIPQFRAPFKLMVLLSWFIY
jgi:hypothetical protein